MRAYMCMRGDVDGEKNGTDRQSGVKRERKEKEKERKTGMWSETEKQSVESARLCHVCNTSLHTNFDLMMDMNFF